MFESQNIKIPSEIKTEPVFDPKTIPVHTMQNDVDMLSGKIENFAPVFTEEKKTNAGLENRNLGNNLNVYSANNSPFMQTATPSTVPLAKNIVDSQKPSGMSNVSNESLKSSNLGKIAGILVGILVFLGALGGGYYFYMTRYNTPVIESEIIPIENVPEVVPEEIPVVIPEKFSADKPNYLLLDVEKMTAEDIQKLFIQKAVEIKEDKKTVPIEFVIVDANNNPIALKIFALLMKVNFSQKLLDNFQDEFSVYIFSDEESARIGLNISLKDTAKIMTDMKTEEKTLVKNLNTLFLGETTNNQAVSFQDARYNDTDIRYMNLNEQNSLSVDYFMTGEKMIMVTSKNATYAIIDKIKGRSQD